MWQESLVRAILTQHGIKGASPALQAVKPGQTCADLISSETFTCKQIKERRYKQDREYWRILVCKIDDFESAKSRKVT